MQNITLQGTPSQMGQQHGALLAGIPLRLPPPDPKMTTLAAACGNLAREHTPQLIEEMKAFADAACLPQVALENMLLTITLNQALPSCSVVAVMPERSADGTLMIGRNYDFTYDISWDAATLYRTYPDTGYAHTGCCDIWIGREDGLNEAGLFVAMSATFLPGVQAGLPFWFIVRHLLEHCATVEEALGWIQSVPHSQSRNYMLADSRQAVVVEASIDESYVREPENGVLVMTNHTVHPALIAQEPFRPDDSPLRYARLTALADTLVSADDMQAALNDRTNHVCAHGTVFSQPFGTIWSMVACPAKRQLAIAQGTGDNKGRMMYTDYTV